MINQVYPQYIPWDDSFQTVKTKKLETHTNQSNLPCIYQAGYELKIAKFSYKLNQFKSNQIKSNQYLVKYYMWKIHMGRATCAKYTQAVLLKELPRSFTFSLFKSRILHLKWLIIIIHFIYNALYIKVISKCYREKYLKVI